MRQRLSTADLSVEELLSGRFSFSVPPYQRQYAWTRDEAVQLIDDIVGVLDDTGREIADTPYFLGAMLFVTNGNGEGPQPVDVVDGQQRLITLVILLAVLRDLASSEAEKTAIDRLLLVPDAGGGRRYQLGLRQSDDAFLRIAIQTQGATRRSQPPATIGENVGRANVEEVRRVLRHKLMKEFDKAGRAAFLAFLRQHVRVLVVTSDDLDYAYQIFLTINDRGKRLSVEDIFRGEILGPLDGDQRRALRERHRRDGPVHGDRREEAREGQDVLLPPGDDLRLVGSRHHRRTEAGSRGARHAAPVRDRGVRADGGGLSGRQAVARRACIVTGPRALADRARLARAARR